MVANVGHQSKTVSILKVGHGEGEEDEKANQQHVHKFKYQFTSFTKNQEWYSEYISNKDGSDNVYSLQMQAQIDRILLLMSAELPTDLDEHETQEWNNIDQGKDRQGPFPSTSQLDNPTIENIWNVKQPVRQY